MCNCASAIIITVVSFLLLCLQGEQLRILGSVNSFRNIVCPVFSHMYNALNSWNIKVLGFFLFVWIFFPQNTTEETILAATIKHIIAPKQYKNILPCLYQLFVLKIFTDEQIWSLLIFSFSKMSPLLPKQLWFD